MLTFQTTRSGVIGGLLMAALTMVFASGAVASPALDDAQLPASPEGMAIVAARLNNTIPLAHPQTGTLPSWAWEVPTGDPTVRLVRVHCQFAEGEDTCSLPDVLAYVRSTLAHQAQTAGMRVVHETLADKTVYHGEDLSPCDDWIPACNLMTHEALSVTVGLGP